MAIKLNKEDIENILDLSPLQKGLFFHYMKNDNSNMYHEQISILLKGKINPEILQRSLDILIQKNEMLRTAFRWKDIQSPVQIIFKKYFHPLIFKDFSDLTYDHFIQVIENNKAEDLDDKFNLELSPVRFYFLKGPFDFSHLILSNHHILFDGWSTGIILKELFGNYISILNNKPVQDSIKADYKQFLKYLRSSENKENISFWSNYLKGFSGKSNIPGSYAEMKGEYCYSCNHEVDSALYYRINTFCINQKATISDLFYLAWGIFLYRYNDKKDVVFGITGSGRSLPIPGQENSVGLYINTVPLRLEFNGNECLTDLLTKLKENKNIIINRFIHTQLNDIKEYCNIPYKDELFDSILVVENYPLQADILIDSGIEIKKYSAFELTNYPLSIQIILFDNKIQINVIQQQGSEGNLTGNIVERLIQIVKNIISSPKNEVQNFSILSDNESTSFLNYSFVNSQNIDTNIAERFDQSVQLHKDKIAIVSENQHFSYDFVQSNALKIAAYLNQLGIKDEDLVAVALNRKVEAYFSFLGILNIGAVFLPIDPTYPDNRIQYMLKHSGVKYVITCKETSFIQFGKDVIVIDVNTAIESIKKEIKCKIPSGNIAYLLYTSGSTGQPKGIAIEHKSILNFAEGIYSIINFSQNKSILAVTTFCFDIFILEFILPLLKGMRIYLCSDGEQNDIVSLSNKIKMQAIEMLQFTPSRLRILKEYDPDLIALKRVNDLMVGGEEFPLSLFRQVKHHYKRNIFNMYGPTETTIWSTVKDLTSTDTVTLGKPILNTSVYVLDSDLNLQPAGFQGELYIGGFGLARGYWKNNKETEERFISFSQNNERIYRTGDIVRWLSSMEIDFIRRKDDQIKLRGYRIELKEIETIMSQFEGITHCVVTVKNTGGEDSDLYCYYSGSTEIENEKLFKHAKQNLASYMIPQHFIFVKEFEYTPNGKIDKKKLPKFDIEKKVNTKKVIDVVEYQLMTMWSDVLKISSEQIGIHSSFFSLGGESIKATLVLLRINKQFQLNLSIRHFFDNPTIKQMSDCIRSAKSEGIFPFTKALEKDFYIASSSQKRLFLLQVKNPDSTAYNMTQALKLSGNITVNAISEIFNQLIALHESMRTTFHVIDEQIVQVIHDKLQIEVDLIQSDKGNTEEIIRNFIKPFDLGILPLIRVGMVRCESLDCDYILIIDIHHIIADEASHQILRQEFKELLCNKKVKKNNYSYKDFSEWMLSVSETKSYSDQKNYWINRFSDKVPVININPNHQENNDIPVHKGGIEYFNLDNEIYMKLMEVTNNEKVTLYMALLACYNILLYKHSGSNEIVVTSPVLTRPHINFQDLTGIFVNMIPFRNCFKPNQCFTSFLNDVKNNVINDLSNSHYQFENIVIQLNILEKYKRNVLIDFVFVLRNISDTKIIKCSDGNGNKFGIEEYTITKEYIHNPMQIDVIEDSGSIRFELAYSKRYYNKIFAEKLRDNFIHIINQVVQNPQIPINEIAVQTTDNIAIYVKMEDDNDFKF